MIVTIVTETYLPDINGVAMTLDNLVSGIARLGHKIQLVCPERKKRTHESLHKNISYHPVRGMPIPGYNEVQFGLPSKSLLHKLWKSNIPDIIYVATEGPLGWNAVKTANKLNIPIISGFHTNFHSYSSHYNIGLLEKVVARYLVKLHNKTEVTLTPSFGQKLSIQKMGINNVSVIGRGVDTDLFSAKKRSHKLRETWGVNTINEPVLLYVGRIAAEKNLELAVKSYRKMYEINKKVKFVLVGDGPLLHKLKKDNPDFIFAGVKRGEELAQYYASSDIFIFPSMSETFGNVVLEAMASGLGVIAYDYAAASMHIYPGKNGQLAYFGDSSEFVEKACIYLNNYLFLQRIQMNASIYAKSQSWDEIIKQFESILINYTLKNSKKEVMCG